MSQKPTEVFSVLALMSAIVGQFIMPALMLAPTLIFGCVSAVRLTNNPDQRGKGYLIATGIISLISIVFIMLKHS